MDRTLDDIIATNRKNKAGRGRGGRGGRGAARGRGAGRGRGTSVRRSSTAPAPTRGRRSNITRGGPTARRWSHDLYTSPTRGAARRGRGGLSRVGPGVRTTAPAKLLLSNLDFGVSDADLTELFGEFGALKSVAVHYDRNGRSQGSAHVTFARMGDAVRAIKQYGGVPLDGRPMNIILDNSGIPGADPLQGLAATRPRTTMATGRISKQTASPRRLTRGKGRISSGRVSSGRGVGSKPTARGGRGRGRGGRGRREDRPKKTAMELDEELDAYVNAA